MCGDRGCCFQGLGPSLLFLPFLINLRVAALHKRHPFEDGSPHVVVLLEEYVILHSPLLKLYVHTAPVDGHHLADTIVVSLEPGAEFHESRDSIASSGWQGHVGLEHLLQECQHVLFFHLKRLRLLTVTFQQEVSILANTPGRHLNQWLLDGR